MAFSKKKDAEELAEETIPLTSLSVDIDPDSISVNIGDISRRSETEAENVSVLSSPPPQSKVSFILDMEKADAKDHIENLHDEVAKLFEQAPKFNLEDLSGGSETVVLGAGSRGEIQQYPEPTPAAVENIGFDEADFKSHRRASFPHIHMPLKPSSKSYKNIQQLAKDKGHRRKRKKSKENEQNQEEKQGMRENKVKKDEQVKRRQSYPSKAVLTAPSIPEVEVEEYTDSESSDNEEKELDKATAQIPQIKSPDVLDGAHLLKPIAPDSRKGSSDLGQPVGFYIGEGREHDMSPSPFYPRSSFDSAFLDSRRASSTSLDKSEDKQLTGQGQSGSFSVFDQDETEPPSLAVSRSPSATDDMGKVKFQLGDGQSQESSLDPVWVLHESEPQKSQEMEKQSALSQSSHGSKSDTKLHHHHHKHKHHHHHHHHDHFKKEDLLIRRQRGSEVQLQDVLRRVPTETDEASMLQKADLDEMASHRREDMYGLRRHKIDRKKKSTVSSVVYIGKTEKARKKLRASKKYDHSPHEVFVELDELYMGENHDIEWREKARWIKFEEDVEEGADRWGKPHVASLSFHSLLELRKGLENGSILLDLEASDLPTIVTHVVENMVIHDQIKSENKGHVKMTLLMKHKHQRDQLSLRKTLSSTSFHHSPSSHNVGNLNQHSNSDQGHHTATKHRKSHDVTNAIQKPEKNDVKELEFVKSSAENSMQKPDGIHIGITTQESQSQSQRHIQDIMRRIPRGSEATTVLVGSVDYLSKPAMAFVRLAEGQVLENLTEVPLPVRFLFILLGPPVKSGMDYHEVGRSLSTLMSNQHFHDVAYKAETRPELLQAINTFLDESIVLPPGDWDQKTLLPIMDMARKRAKLKRRLKEKEVERQALIKREEKDKVPQDPLKRTKRLFGGLINDIKRRYPYYLSDITDVFSLQCIMAFIFIFFACLAPCIAFGGLYEEKTKGLIGVTETMLGTSITGVVFGLFSTQPLLIMGASGPVLVFEKHLFSFCKNSHIDFLPWRVWIGLWVFIITLLVLAFEGSFMVRYITRFTEEVFAVLISLIFIFEVVDKLELIYEEHPLKMDYCDTGGDDSTGNSTRNMSTTTTALLSTTVITVNNSFFSVENDSDYALDDYTPESTENKYNKRLNQPNTALLSTILIFGTFLIAYFLRVFRNSTFLGRSARRALGDFGIMLAMVLMVLFDYFLADTYTQKLQLDTLGNSEGRIAGFIVNPMGSSKYQLEVWHCFVAVIPAFLIFILLFLEVQLTEMLLHKKEFKLKKGSGFHMDQFLAGLMSFVCALFGLPWMCAATVRTIAHHSALCVLSRTHAPGEKPKLLEVRDQRVTNILMNILIGVAILWEDVLHAIPITVLFGVFLYLGVSALNGVQLFKRFKLLFMPVKHHPQVSYVRRVRTWKMHVFTVIQVVLVALLWTVKSTQGAIIFPLLVFLMIPLRLRLMPKIFTHDELAVLDKEDEDSEDEDEPDFYERAHMPI